jgi:hypothetical protein
MAVGEDWVPVGDKDYLYGWSWRVYPDESRSGGGSDDVFLDGENLYILASYWNIEDDVTEENGIYRVNISTNETVRMSEREAMAFKREGDFLYYLNEGALYRVSIKDGKEEFVKQLAQPSVDISGFEIFGGKCYWGKIENEGYYIDENYYNSEGYYLYDDDGKIVNEGAAFLGMKLAGDKKEYLICTFAETDSSKYRIVIFDASGAAIFKSSDTAQIGSMHIIGKTLIFVNRTTGTLCKANL